MDDAWLTRLSELVADLFPDGTGVHVRRSAVEPGAAADRPDAGEGCQPVLPEALRDAVPSRQQEFLSGRTAALHALRQAGAKGKLGVPVGALRAPQWPAGFSGSISHGAGIAAAVAAPWRVAQSLGLDLEAMVDSGKAAPLRTLVGRPAEWTLLAGLAARPGAQESLAFTTLFSAKEALFKCLAPRVGRYFDFLDAELSSLQAGSLTLALRLTLAPEFPAGRRFAVRFETLDGLLVCGTALPGVPQDGVKKTA